MILYIDWFSLFNRLPCNLLNCWSNIFNTNNNGAPWRQKLSSGKKAQRAELAKAGKVRVGKGKIMHVGGVVFVWVRAYIF